MRSCAVQDTPRVLGLAQREEESLGHGERGGTKPVSSCARRSAADLATASSADTSFSARWLAPSSSLAPRYSAESRDTSACAAHRRTSTRAITTTMTVRATFKGSTHQTPAPIQQCEHVRTS